MYIISDEILMLNPRSIPIKLYNFSYPINTYRECKIIHTFQGNK